MTFKEWWEETFGTLSPNTKLELSTVHDVAKIAWLLAEMGAMEKEKEVLSEL